MSPKPEARWTDAERQALPLPECRRAATLPSCIFSSLINKTAEYLRAKALAVSHTLCSSVSETTRCPLGAVTEMVHCPAAAAAAADPSREQTDRQPASSPPLLLSPPPPPPVTSASSSSRVLLRFLSFLHPVSENPRVVSRYRCCTECAR